MALSLWQTLGIEKAHLVAHDMGDSVLTEILARRDRGALPDHFKNFFQVRLNVVNGLPGNFNVLILLCRASPSPMVGWSTSTLT